MAANTLTHGTEHLAANFEAFLSDEDVKRLEVAASCQARGQQRRLCLVACARNAETLKDMLDEEPDAFEAMLDAVEAFREHAKALAEISETAYARMMLVGLESEKPTLM